MLASTHGSEPGSAAQASGSSRVVSAAPAATPAPMKALRVNRRRLGSITSSLRSGRCSATLIRERTDVSERSAR